MTILTLINVFAFVLVVARIIRLSGIPRCIRALLGLMLLAGPLYAFSVYSFSEMLTTALLLELTIALLAKKPNWYIWVLTFLLASSRETAILMILPIAGAVIMLKYEMVRPALHRLGHVLGDL